MKKILLLSLGGTIVCVKTKRGLMPRLSAPQMLSFVTLPKDVMIESIHFLNRTILFPEDWILLSRKISAVYDRFDGFVVTLGTDSLAFVSSALSLMLKNLSKPIVLTGAMEPIQSPNSDGRKNLVDSILVAREGSAGGVFVVFSGKIINGSAVSKIRCDSSDAFESVNSPLCGTISGKRVQWLHKPALAKAGLRLAPELDTRVITVTLTPQMDEAFVKLLVPYRGIIVEGYGDGNIPSDLIPTFLKLTKKRIVVLASQCLYGRLKHRYEGGAALIRKGACSGGSMTKEMMCVKLMWALGQSKDRNKIRSIFKRSR